MRKLHAPVIRSALVRISKELKASPVNFDKDRRAKETVLLPAVEFIEAAIAAMKEPGTNPAGALQQCRLALEKLGKHAGLAKVITELDDLIENRVKYET